MAKDDTKNAADTADMAEDSGANYVMGQIVVDDGTAQQAPALEEYAEEVSDADSGDEAEKKRAARRKLMSQSNSDDALVGNPKDTDDFSKHEKFDADEDWPLE